MLIPLRPGDQRQQQHQMALAPLPTDQAGVTTPAVDPNALVMNFTSDCWLEVTDATGKKLFSGMQRKDGNLNLTGRAPYKLKIARQPQYRSSIKGNLSI